MAEKNNKRLRLVIGFPKIKLIGKRPKIKFVSKTELIGCFFFESFRKFCSDRSTRVREVSRFRTSRARNDIFFFICGLLNMR